MCSLSVYEGDCFGQCLEPQIDKDKINIPQIDEAKRSKRRVANPRGSFEPNPDSYPGKKNWIRIFHFFKAFVYFDSSTAVKINEKVIQDEHLSSD